MKWNNGEATKEIWDDPNAFPTRHRPGFDFIMGPRGETIADLCKRETEKIAQSAPIRKRILLDSPETTIFRVH
jgi:hypothetical protein